MNVNPNQHIFEEFQKSVDQARALAQKLGPEHFCLAYDRCAKLQKVIFKRACGYCYSPIDSNNSLENGSFEKKMDSPMNQMTSSTNLAFLNIPSFSLCRSGLPLVLGSTRADCPHGVVTGTEQQPSGPSDDVGRTRKFVMLKQHSETVPSQDEEDVLEKEGCVVKQSVMASGSLKEMLQGLHKSFPSCGERQYELCVPDKNSPTVLVPVTEDQLPYLASNQNGSTVFLRPMEAPVSKTMKVESSVPQSEKSTGSARINCFMVDPDKSHLSDESAFPEGSDGSVFPETIFSSDIPHKANMNITVTEDCKNRSTRSYNWSVVLSNLHENHPTQLRNESVRFPDVCHELHAIPPTPQKLRPTKRCQLCLKGYKSRKESRYYCRPCDKGFHIKCFEVYHQQLGYVQYKVKIISGER